MQVVFETEFYTLYHDDERAVLLQQWRGGCPSEVFRATHTKSLRYFVESGCRHVVSDIRLAPPLPPADARWAAEEILGRYQQAGLERLRVVRPLAAQTRQIADNLGRYGMSVVVYDSLEEALDSIK
jgi:hypothetical protein